MMMNCPMMAGQTSAGWHELPDDAGSIRHSPGLIAYRDHPCQLKSFHELEPFCLELQFTEGTPLS